MYFKILLWGTILLISFVVIKQQGLLPDFFNSTNDDDIYQAYLEFNPEDYNNPPKAEIILKSPKDSTDYQVGDVIKCSVALRIYTANGKDSDREMLLWFVNDEFVGRGIINKKELRLPSGYHKITVEYINFANGAHAEKSFFVNVLNP